MTTYTAYFYTDGDFATRRFEADTPEQAPALARQFYADDAVDLILSPMTAVCRSTRSPSTMRTTKSLRFGATTPSVCSLPRVICSMP